MASLTLDTDACDFLGWSDPSRSEPSPDWLVAESHDGNVKVQVSGSVVEATTGRPLTPSDVAERALRLGEGCLGDFAGSFVLAAGDARDKTAWCATDPAGTMPLFYRVDDHSVTLAASGRDVLACSSTLALNQIGLLQFLVSGYCWRGHTILSGWHVVVPGSSLRFCQGKRPEQTVYFAPEQERVELGYSTERELVADLDEVLGRIASRYDRLLVPLSGGRDSRLIAVRCHALGIPIGAVSFYASRVPGDDFDVATRVCDALGVTLHPWKWDSAQDEALEHFDDLIVSSGGMCDAFTSYPDGMLGFGSISANYDCALRGEEWIGWDSSPADGRDALAILELTAATVSGFLRRDRTPSADETLTSWLHSVCGWEPAMPSAEASSWLNHFWRESRIPRYNSPVAAWQRQFCAIEHPLLAKTLMARLAKTPQPLRDDKIIEERALDLYSPEAVRAIPFSTKPTWAGGEPFLGLPCDVHAAIRRAVEGADWAADLVDLPALVEAVDRLRAGGAGTSASYWMASDPRFTSHSLRAQGKRLLNDHLPPHVVAALKRLRPRRSPVQRPDLLMKRVYAVQRFLRRAST